ncbi:hypothetical protein M885DRAFT_557621 [Pelagophyceae sp. CCMP2097]|nr:hypothetical protein M885DRAFT_557621 [Pelagophyceae sp. CCMP2097]
MEAGPEEDGGASAAAPLAAPADGAAGVAEDGGDDGEESAFQAGDDVLSENQGVWYPAAITQMSWRTKKRQRVCMFKVHYDGWAIKWDEWFEGGAQLKRRTPANLAMAAASLAEAESEAESERQAKQARKPTPAPAPAPGAARPRSTHPPYAEMVACAVDSLRGKGPGKAGASAVAVGKWIAERYTINSAKYKVSIAAALKLAVSKGDLVKHRASYSLSPTQQRIRDASNGLPVVAQLNSVDDLDLEAQLLAVDAASVPPRPPCGKLALLSPPAAAGPILAVAEFCHAFDALLGRVPTPRNGAKSGGPLTFDELDAALASLRGASAVPPLLERLVLALLRLVCGRDAFTGDADSRVALEAEQYLYVGHRQNRRLWGHVLNALTWPDVLRRHLGAERRHRARLRAAHQSAAPSAPRIEKWAAAEAEPPQKRSKPAALAQPKEPVARTEAKAHAKAQSDAAAAAYASHQHAAAAAHFAAAPLGAARPAPWGPQQPAAPVARLGAAEFTLPPPPSQAPAHKVVSRPAAAPASNYFHQDYSLNHPSERPPPGTIIQGHGRPQYGAAPPPSPRASNGAPVPLAKGLPPPRKRALNVAKRAGVDAKATRYPYAEAQDGDDWVLAEALHDFCDRRVAFHALRPEAAAALLQTLVDDVLEAPALQRAVRDGEALVDALAKAARAAQTQAKRRVGDDGREVTDRQRAAAVSALDTAQQALAAGAAQHAVRRDELGDDRAWSRHWRLESDGGKRVTVRLSARDARRGDRGAWAVFDTPHRLDALAKSLEARGAREAVLAERLERDEALPRNGRTKKEGDAAAPAPSGAQRIADARRCPPPPASRAAALAWPDGGDDSPPPARDAPAPARGARRPSPSPRASVASAASPGGLEVDDFEARAGVAAAAAAPWRSRLARREFALAAYAQELRVTNVRLEGMACGAVVDESALAACALESVDAVALASLATEALRAEDRLFLFITHGTDPGLERREEGDDDGEAPASPRPPSPVNGGDDVERDEELELEWGALSGPCADDAAMRGAWRDAVADLGRNVSGARDAASAEFCTLYALLREQVARHVPAIEARVDAAARMLLDDGAPARAAAAVYVPSAPTADVVWARIRGYPWWPARRHAATRADFSAALQRRQLELVVFFGESVQYCIPTASLADFTGLADDPRLPKPGKASAKGLLEAVRVARLDVEERRARTAADAETHAAAA